MAILIGRLAEPPTQPARFIAGAHILAMDVLGIGEDGRVIPLSSYDRSERIVRRLGSFLRRRRLARWHERTPIGISLVDAAPGEMVTLAAHGLSHVGAISEIIQRDLDDHNEQLQEMMRLFAERDEAAQ